MFKNKGLDIIINCNIKIVNYLDVTLNLNDGSYRPYKKPNEETNYIQNTKHYNCLQKENCSMNGACLKENLVY